MTTGKGYAPTGKSKVIATPDVNRNNKLEYLRSR